MTREELKEHCKRQVQQFERVKEIMPVTPNDWKRYEEHKLVLELLEQESKTGHWIENAPQYDMLNPQYICSECGNAHTRTTPYCEMCGAKMVEPQESGDKE